MAETACFVSFGAVVTLHAKTHLGHVSFRRPFVGRNAAMTVNTVYPTGDMLFMVEVDTPDRVDQLKRFFGVLMAGTAFVVILNVMTGATLLHGRQVLVGRPGAGFYLGVTVDTLDLLLHDMKLMGEGQFALGHNQTEIKATLR